MNRSFGLELDWENTMAEVLEVGQWIWLLLSSGFEIAKKVVEESLKKITEFENYSGFSIWERNKKRTHKQNLNVMRTYGFKS